MCRMVGYLGGPEATLSSVALEGEHSLVVQSYAPREMMSGVVNVDGFGVGWYVPEDGEPAVYRSNGSLWSDRSFAGIAPKIRSRAVFAAVRSATPGLPVEESGAIRDFRQKAMRPLRDALSEEAYSGLLGISDSETIFAGLLDLLRDDPTDLADAARETIRHVSSVCDGLGVEATLNLAVTDGTGMVFTRYSTDGPGNSLYVLEDATGFTGAVVVASERLDEDPAWREVPDRCLLSARRGSGVTLSPL
jgi:glutamine amidotransferase